ncbi:PAS domain-containing protein [Ferruginibacter sp. HRS2-29]|uniref:PAS domain-containing protein n=1 Tax=Ferruginibacter sp. HRS2-29 TaxID=2487334 RepID=UPI0020CC7D9C|nr:PAS domain-containing protein [Ferruginibacter sp. HRS2-29]MCP9750552.1 PAS domain S-box protein [Ferruginibacter sp. HRS2-29]
MQSQSSRFTKEQLLEILSLSHNATAIYTGEELTIQSANNAMLALWGRDRSVIGKSLIDVLPELHDQPFFGLLRQVLATGITYEGTDTPAQLMRSGTLQTYYFDFVYRAIRNASGEVDCILHTATEVTELHLGRELQAEMLAKDEALNREQSLNEELAATNEELVTTNEDLASTLEELSAANEELNEARSSLQNLNEALEIRVTERTEKLAQSITKLSASENRTRAIIEAAPFPIGVYIGREMRIAFVNQAIADVWGKGNDLVGRLYSEVLPELDNQLVYQQLDHVFTTGITFEARNQRIDLVVNGVPTIFYFNYIFTALREEDGTIYGVMNTAADVTDVMLAKQEVEESAQQLASLNEELAAVNEELVASNEEQYRANEELAELYEKLRISQDELQLAIEAAGLATFDFNPTTGRFTGNELLKSWFGLKPEEEIELDKATDVILPSDRERVIKAINHAITFESDGNYDTSYTISPNQLNAEPRMVRAKGKALFNENKEPTRLSGVLQDVTEQMTSQAKMRTLIANLASSEKRFRSLVKQAPVAMNVFKGEEFIIDSVNDRMLEIWGKTEAVNGMRFIDVLPELADQPFIDILNKVRATGQSYYGVENIAEIIKDGIAEKRYFNFIYQPIMEEEGRIDSILQVLTEVTEQVNARKEIADINTRLNIAIDAGSLGSTEVDLASGTMQCNEQFKKYYGRSKDEIFNYPDLFDAMLPEYRDKIKKLVAIAIENKSIYQSEYEVAWPDSSRHWIKAYGKARYDSSGKAVKMVGLVSDITEAKKDEQRKNDFIGMVSHELKTPLTSLTAYVQMLQEKFRNGNDDFTMNSLDMANKQVKKMTTMINGFLNISRLESGKIHIDSSRFDMALLLKEVQQETVIAVTTHTVIFAPVEETFVIGDREKIGQVIHNFISNAAKYSPLGTTIHVACISTGNSAQVSVADEGMGIRPEDQQKLFERYYRVKDQPVSIAGFGIGLYVCAEIIQRHEGKIWVESEPGEGSTFYFTLPL